MKPLIPLAFWKWTVNGITGTTMVINIDTTKTTQSLQTKMKPKAPSTRKT